MNKPSLKAFLSGTDKIDLILEMLLSGTWFDQIINMWHEVKLSQRWRWEAEISNCWFIIGCQWTNKQLWIAFKVFRAKEYYFSFVCI